ncbi:AaceriAER306Cp [[Ashbya] aceris (nom. inval.)]|nr:AaceriAER306Cp [[Ashbya] aceris (nom. inval.)]
MADDKKGQMGNADDIQAKLDKRLGPEYISKRVGHGTTRVAYIEGWKAINLANQIFGFNGWSSEVKSVTVDFMDERQGRFTIGCTAVVRVTLSDGTFREDIGYGTVENDRRKSGAFERAKKSAVTDALKRSLRGFGNALGNCLYDKDFLSKIDKVKFEPPDFDEGNLFRATDENNELSRANTVADHAEGPAPKKRNAPLPPVPRPVAIRPEVAHAVPTALEPTLERPRSSENDQEDLLDDSFMFSDELQDDDLINIGSAKKPPSGMPRPAPPPPPRVWPPQDAPVTFVTAKAAPDLQAHGPVPPTHIFDPKFQAQSIRHTVDQTTSAHVKLSVLRDKGIEQTRDDIYSKFAPKGKILPPPDTATDPDPALAARPALSAPQNLPTNTSSIQRPTMIELPKLHFPQPSAVPLSNVSAPRREVGRPKQSPPSLRKPPPQ